MQKDRRGCLSAWQGCLMSNSFFTWCSKTSLTSTMLLKENQEEKTETKRAEEAHDFGSFTLWAGWHRHEPVNRAEGLLVLAADGESHRRWAVLPQSAFWRNLGTFEGAAPVSPGEHAELFLYKLTTGMKNIPVQCPHSQQDDGCSQAKGRLSTPSGAPHRQCLAPSVFAEPCPRGHEGWCLGSDVPSPGCSRVHSDVCEALGRGQQGVQEDGRKGACVRAGVCVCPQRQTFK